MIHLDGIVFSLQRYGGISVYFKALAAGLAESSMQMQLAIPAGELMGKPPEGLSNRLTYQTVRLFERYRDYPCDQAIGHSSYYRLPKNDAKSVITVYDFTYEKFFRPHQKIIHSWQKNRAIHRADAVICISESTRSDLFKYLPNVPRHKVHVVHLGINPPFLQESSIHAVHSVPTQQPYFIYVGARSTYKNFMPVLHALEHRHEHLICVGGGELTPDESQAILRYTPGRVHHIAWADDITLAQLYRHAVALVFPSLYEGFGIPVAEAMACRCPVIAMNESSIPEVAGQAGCLLPEINESTLRVAFDAVSDPIKRTDMVELGFERAQSFSWKSCCEQTMQIYSQLIM